MRYLLSVLVLVLLALANAAVTAGRPGMAEVNGEALYFDRIAAPATFKGTLPCADCPGIDYHLNLLEDGVYFLRETYQDRDNGSFDDIGRYLLSSDRDQLTLYGGREAPLRFALLAPDTLRLLDRDGRHIDSELNYNLSRQPEFEPFEPQLLLRGMYRYFADAGRFQECLSTD